MSVGGYKFTVLTGGGAGALDAQDGAALLDGDIAMVMTVAGLLYFYELAADSGLTESSPDVIAPDTNAGLKRWILKRSPQTNSVPVGTVIQWIGGYFTNNANAGFTSVLGNTPAAFNALYNSEGFYACDGALLNLAGSGCFNGAGRYLPNATNSVFLMGFTSAGTIGGSNDASHTHTIAHTHTTGSFTLTTSEMPNHAHTLTGGSGGGTVSNHGWDQATPTGAVTGYTGGGAAHNHGSTGASSAANSGVASATENRPNFLSVIVGIKVI